MPSLWRDVQVIGKMSRVRAEPLLLLDGWDYPTGLAFGPDGTAYVCEAGLPWGGARPGGRVWRLDGSHRVLIADGLRPPLNGLCWYRDGLLVAEGGYPAALTRVELDGSRKELVSGLPGPGNYHVNAPTPGPDGRIYFSQGAMTNSGIIGLDSQDVAWLRHVPHAADVPGLDITLLGVNAETPNPVHGSGPARTGAFSPFGTPTRPGQRVPAGLPPTAAVLSCEADGSDLEVVAWGLRNAYGMAFLPDGKLLALDQGADDRGSRPIGNAPDLLVEVHGGCWYGWPDFIAGDPVTHPRFRPERGDPPQFLLAHDDLPEPQPALLELPPHVAATRLALGPPHAGPWAGQLAVAFFGDEPPMTLPPGKPRAERSVARVDPADWSLHPGVQGPWQRPIDVAFHPDSGQLWVVDFGEFEITEGGVAARAGSGAVWQVAAEPGATATEGWQGPG